MYFWTIIKKEVLQNIRDKKVMMIMTLMPLAIIMIMGLAISGAFEQRDVSLEDITIEYVQYGQQTDFSLALDMMLKETLLEEKIILSRDEDQSKIHVASNDVDGLLVVDSDLKKVNFYYNEEFGIKGSVMQTLLNNFVRRYKVFVETEQLTSDNSYVTSEYLSADEGVSAMDYYGVAMSVLFVFYGVPMAISSVIKEKRSGTLNRILLTPASRFEILFGKTIGSITVSALQLTIVMAGTILFFGVNWGQSFISWLQLMTMVVFAVSIGVALGFFFNSEDKAMGIIHVLIVIFGLFGGSYVPTDYMGFIGDLGKFFSPIWWNMSGLMNMIYGSSYSGMYQAVLVNLAGALVLLSITAYYVKRKVVNNG